MLPKLAILKPAASSPAKNGNFEASCQASTKAAS